MPLEAVTYISDLVVTNPVNATDQVAQGDDHIRAIKTGIKNTFPNVAGAVTPTHTELNYVAGVTSAIQTQINGKAASSHAHSAADLTSGTVPDARFPATLPAASGVNLTALNGTNIASGTVADARLSNNIPKKDLSNTFTGIAQFVQAGVSAQAEVNVVGNNGTAGTGLGLIDDGSTGYLYQRANRGLEIGTNSASRLVISAAGNFDFKAGTVTTSGASAAEVGTHGVVQNAQSADYTCVLGDRDKHIYATKNGAQTVTIPANASVAYPLGTTLTFVANAQDGSSALTIAITSDTLYLAGTGFATSGSRTLARGGVATAVKFSSTGWLISGAGLS